MAGYVELHCHSAFSLLDGVKVDYYGTLTPLQQVGTLSVPESRLITITPWDNKMIGPIEKAGHNTRFDECQRDQNIFLSSHHGKGDV